MKRTLRERGPRHEQGGVRAKKSDEEKAMKKFGLWSLSIVATVILTLAFSAVAGPKAPSANAAVAPASPVVAAPVPPPHPRVHEAIEALRGAREHMAHAEGEFRGHRDKAIEHIDAAIHEAEICEREP
jgi:uncharacterized iron-regulated membrane protein